MVNKYEVESVVVDRKLVWHPIHKQLLYPLDVQLLLYMSIYIVDIRSIILHAYGGQVASYIII